MDAIEKFQETERKAEDLIWRLDIFIREAANLNVLESREQLMDRWTPLKAFVREIIRDNGKLMEKLEVIDGEEELEKAAISTADIEYHGDDVQEYERN